MRKLCLLMSLMGYLCGGMAVAQEEAEEADQAPVASQAGAQLEAQVRVLAVVQTLGLEPAQAQVILPLLAEAQTRRQSRTQALDALWEQSQASLEAADAALVAGRRANRRAVSAVEKALERHRRIMDDTDADLEKIGQDVLSKLNRDQAAMIETVQQAEARATNLERFEGAPSLAHYIARYAVAMRSLLPDEYAALRVAMGLRLAERLVAPDSRLFNSAVTDSLRIMDTVRRLSDAEFAQREEGLPQAIGRALQLRDAGAGDWPPVRYREFMYFVASPQSVTVLTKLAGAAAAPAEEVAPAADDEQAALATPGAVAGDTRHPLTRALDYDANLVLVADLNPTNRQLLDIMTVSRGARQLVTAYEQANRQSMARLQPMLEQAERGLAGGEEPGGDVAVTLEEAQADREERYQQLLRSVGKQVDLVRRALGPEQARLVNWTAPAEASADDQEAVVGELRLLASNLDQARQMISTIRYLIVSDYSITRIARVEEYLKMHERPGTPQFAADREWMLRHLEQARMVEEADWPQQAPVFAAQVLQRLGLLEARPAGQAQTNYNWWDVYYLLTDVQTPEMLQAMLAAGGG